MRNLEKRTSQLEAKYGEVKPPFTKITLFGIYDEPRVLWQHPSHSDADEQKIIRVTIGRD